MDRRIPLSYQYAVQDFPEIVGKIIDDYRQIA